MASLPHFQPTEGSGSASASSLFAREAMQYLLWEKRTDRAYKPPRKRSFLAVASDPSCSISGIDFFVRSPFFLFYPFSLEEVSSRLDSIYAPSTLLWTEDTNDLCLDLSGRAFSGQYRYTERCLFNLCAFRRISSLGRLILETQFFPSREASPASSVVIPPEFLSLFNSFLRLIGLDLGRTGILADPSRRLLLFPLPRWILFGQKITPTLERFFRTISRCCLAPYFLAEDLGWRTAFAVEASGTFWSVFYDPQRFSFLSPFRSTSQVFHPAIAFFFSLSKTRFALAAGIHFPDLPFSFLPLKIPVDCSNLFPLPEVFWSEKAFRKTLTKFWNFCSTTVCQTWDRSTASGSSDGAFRYHLIPTVLADHLDLRFANRITSSQSLFRFVTSGISNKFAVSRLRVTDSVFDFFCACVYYELAHFSLKKYLLALLSYCFLSEAPLETGWDMLYRLLLSQNDLLMSSSCCQDFFLYLLFLKVFLAFSLYPDLVRLIVSRARAY
jgi:hypothetical protein